MSKPGVGELLIKAALDAEFRDRVIFDPDDVFAEFDLSDEQRDILRKRDERMHGLLAAAVREGMPELEEKQPGPEPHPAEPQPTATTPGPSLRDAKLLLQVVPYAQSDSAGGFQIAYAAALHSLAEGTDPRSVPLPDEGPSGTRLPPLRMMITVAPTLSGRADGQSQLSFSIALETVSDEANSETSETPVAPSVWNHQTESKAARQAVAAIREAAAGDRLDRLIDLAVALRTGDTDG